MILSAQHQPLTTSNGSLIVSHVFRSAVPQVPMVTVMSLGPHIHPQNCPFPGGDWIPLHNAYSWSQPTHYPKRHSDPFSRFSTTHWTNTQKMQKTTCMPIGRWCHIAAIAILRRGLKILLFWCFIIYYQISRKLLYLNSVSCLSTLCSLSTCCDCWCTFPW